jgi:predicted Zn-dependent peptidase
MKKSLSLTILLIALLAAAVMAADVGDVEKLKFPKLNEIKTPDVERITLDNGIRLYLLEDKSLPLFNVNARINCGSYLDPVEKIGLASMCGNVMRTGGTSKWTGDQIDELLEGIGGMVETNIGTTSGSAFVNVLSEYSDVGLEVMAEVLRRPKFDEDKIDLAKVQNRTGISRRNDEVGTVARREYAKQIYGKDSPYARHPEYATIDAINRDDLVNFHQKYFQPQNIQIAIWGDIDKAVILEKVKQYFGDWEKGTTVTPALPKVDYDWRSKVYYVEKKDAKQSYVRVGHLGGMTTDQDYADRIVMNSILGGGFGSRIMDAVRTKMGLAYSTGGRFISNNAYPGYFFAVASTGPENTVKATREMIKQIKSMQTDLPTEVEMDKGKSGYLNSFVFNFDSKREVVGRMMTYDFYGLPEDFLQQEKNRIENVTPEDVMAAAKNNLKPDQMIVLVAGNAEEFDLPLDSLGLGPAEKIDITIPSGEKKKELTINEETLAKGKAILDAGVNAAGGLANFKKVKSVSVKGTLTLVTPNGDFSVQMESIDSYPDKQWSKVSVMGRELFDIRNGNLGWKTDQATGEIVPKSEEDMMESDEEMARNTTLVFQSSDDPPYRAVYDGKGKEGDVAVEMVALVDAEGKPICTISFGAEDHRLVSKSYWGKSMMGEGVIVDIYSQFADVAGLKVPMNIVRNMNGQKVSTISMSTFDVNADIPESTFQKP